MNIYGSLSQLQNLLFYSANAKQEMCPNFAKVGYDTITVKVALRAKLVAVEPRLKFQEVKHHSHITKFFNLLFKFSLSFKINNPLAC